jgi:hypothetical protein
MEKLFAVLFVAVSLSPAALTPPKTSHGRDIPICNAGCDWDPIGRVCVGPVCRVLRVKKIVGL